MKPPSGLVALIAAALLWGAAAAVPAGAQQGPPTPVDPRQSLDDLDAKILKKQRELFAARQRGDAAEVEKLTKEFEAIQKDRGRIVKDTQHLY